MTSLYSASWYRVAEIKPRLRRHVALHRQRFRGALWYVVQDRQTGRFHRLSPAAYHAVCLMDGRRSVDTIWRMVGDRLGDDQPTQDEMLRLLTLLHGADLLVSEIPPDLDEIAARSSRQSRRVLLSKMRNPLAIRLPLLDPDRLLTATLPLVRPLFTVWGLLAWIVLVGGGVALAAMHWSALTDDVIDRAVTAQNAALLLITYPLVKAVHELGHAYATKVWGGEVHEAGVMLLVLVPMPYVDASASAAFRAPWQRIVVGGAGILVEMALAAMALLVWLQAEPGALRAVAYDVMLIGGVSTVFFNGNPLLRFDGYYVLSDLIGIPNLATRANQYVLHLVGRFGFGLADPERAEPDRGTRAWLVGYAVASFLYRTAMTLTIALFVATKLFALGVALAIVTVVAAFVWPIVKGIGFLIGDPRLRGRRRRAVLVAGAAVALVLAAVLALPLPYATTAEGVVWIGENATVRARTDGLVRTVAADGDGAVAAGTTIVALEDPALAAGRTVLDRQRDEVRLRLEAVRLNDVVAANLLREQMRHVEGQLEDTTRRIADLALIADKDGRFLVPEAADLPGRFVRRGEVIGYLVGRGDAIVRAVVGQADVDLVRRRTARVDVRLAERPDVTIPARILREVPTALAELPHPALGTVGGGAVVLDPASTDKPKPLETLFHFDLAPPADALPERLGGRVFVRFDHGTEPVAFRLARVVRQVFLRQFGV
ncbi:peptidase M50 [Rhodoplanes azumiensis]|uniref:Peptidase M50 n=1 Tax=Rhodoplanes azumiensis TaxID=1897628 RepID=A0ABW5AE42_9BRAD